LKFTLESPPAVTIRSTSDREIRIGKQVWSQPIALTPAGVLEEWVAVPVESLTIDDLAVLIDTGPELIVLGTGDQQLLPDRELMFAMARRGIGLEVMDTPAAARTFNVLVSEGRSVAAVLFL
jgi:uncharacterized protein